MAPETFAAVIECVAGARSGLQAFLTGTMPDEVVQVAVLLVSELATNAVRHAHSPFTVSAALQARAVRVEVEDACTQLPDVQPPDVKATGGRGMLLVDALSARWGSELTPGGKRVWFELNVP